MVLDPTIAVTLRLFLSLLFLMSALHKMRSFVRFRETVLDYRLLPPALAGVASVGILGAELGIAAVLLPPSTAGIGLVGAAALLGTYGAAIGINLSRGRRHIDCGCVGPALRQSLSEWLVVRNGGLVTLALAGLAPVTSRPLGWIDLVTIAGGVAVLAATYGSVNQLIGNAPELARLRERA